MLYWYWCTVEIVSHCLAAGADWVILGPNANRRISTSCSTFLNPDEHPPVTSSLQAGSSLHRHWHSRHVRTSGTGPLKQTQQNICIVTKTTTGTCCVQKQYDLCLIRLHCHRLSSLNVPAGSLIEHWGWLNTENSCHCIRWTCITVYVINTFIYLHTTSPNTHSFPSDAALHFSSTTLIWQL